MSLWKKLGENWEGILILTAAVVILGFFAYCANEAILEYHRLPR